MLADSDFLLALAKEEDWLRPAAERMLAAHRGELRCAEASLVELLFLARRHAWDPVLLAAAVASIAPFPDNDVALLAARHQRDHGLTPVDAVVAAHAELRREPVLSSDARFDRVKAPRVPLA